jgi:hypothetical protein
MTTASLAPAGDAESAATSVAAANEMIVLHLAIRELWKVFDCQSLTSQRPVQFEEHPAAWFLRPD